MKSLVIASSQWPQLKAFIMSGKDDTFLRSTAACLRAMAGSQHDVRYTGANTIITPTEVRLPTPQRPNNFNNVAVDQIHDTKIRGAADSAAVWIAHHNDSVHSKMAPQATAARLIFDSVERARVEAVGAEGMPGFKKIFRLRLMQNMPINL